MTPEDISALLERFQTNAALVPVVIAYTPEQAAKATGRSRTRIFNAIKEKELTARKDGGATVLEVEELRRWVRTFPTIGRQPVAA